MANIDKSGQQYVIRTDDGREAGHVNFVDDAGERLIYHTLTEPEFGGQGFASKLVGALIEDTAKEGLTAVGVCPFVESWLEKNPNQVSWRKPAPHDSETVARLRR